jgi:hypothetical protein
MRKRPGDAREPFIPTTLYRTLSGHNYTFDSPQITENKKQEQEKDRCEAESKVAVLLCQNRTA